MNYLWMEITLQSKEKVNQEWVLMGPSEGEWTIRREKPLLFKRHKVVRFLISPKNKKMKIEVNKIMNPAFLFGTAFNIAYWHRKYHSGTICKGVSNPQTSKGNECEVSNKPNDKESSWKRMKVINS